ncbi:hypothetical protein ACH427_26560 [Streptomyces sp. NPDC020379]|uniref:hypothetical protein n=1 Tax=Streptomyces sp. NPDC020379 TaxID=3365071 RepID=UPI0037AE4714
MVKRFLFLTLAGALLAFGPMGPAHAVGRDGARTLDGIPNPKVGDLLPGVGDQLDHIADLGLGRLVDGPNEIV